jgi:hypothetical protein
MKNKFLYEVHCEGGIPSSKRFYGGIGFVTVQLCLIAATIISLIQTKELSGTIASLLDFDLATSAALLGLSTITRIFDKSKTTIGVEKDKEKEEVE